MNLGDRDEAWRKRSFLERKKKSRYLGVFLDENTPIYTIIQKKRLKKHHRTGKFSYYSLVQAVLQV